MALLVINLRHLFGRCGFERGVECFAPGVGGEDRVDQRDRRRRVFLTDRTDLRRFRQQDFAAERHQIAENDLEQRRLADAVAADQADLGSGRNRDARRIEETPAPGVKNEILDPKHGAGRPKYRCVGKILGAHS
jgi:hypothetical protein